MCCLACRLASFLTEKRQTHNLHPFKLCLEHYLRNRPELAPTWRSLLGKTPCRNPSLNPTPSHCALLVVACWSNTVWRQTLQDIHIVCKGRKKNIIGRDKVILHPCKLLPWFTPLGLWIFAVCHILWVAFAFWKLSTTKNSSLVCNYNSKQHRGFEEQVSIKL